MSMSKTELLKLQNGSDVRASRVKASKMSMSH